MGAIVTWHQCPATSAFPGRRVHLLRHYLDISDASGMFDVAYWLCAFSYDEATITQHHATRKCDGADAVPRDRRTSG